MDHQKQKKPLFIYFLAINGIIWGCIGMMSILDIDMATKLSFNNRAVSAALSIGNAVLSAIMLVASIMLLTRKRIAITILLFRSIISLLYSAIILLYIAFNFGTNPLIFALTYFAYLFRFIQAEFIFPILSLILIVCSKEVRGLYDKE